MTLCREASITYWEARQQFPAMEMLAFTLRPIPDLGTFIAVRHQLGILYESLCPEEGEEEPSDGLKIAHTLLGVNWELQPKNILHTLPVTRMPGFAITSHEDQAKAMRAVKSQTPITVVEAGPGTGKTQVAAGAITNSIEEDPGTRILVTSKSNHAKTALAATLHAAISRAQAEGILLGARICHLNSKKQEEATDDPLPCDFTVLFESVKHLGEIPQRLAEIEQLEASLPTGNLDQADLSEEHAEYLRKILQKIEALKVENETEAMVYIAPTIVVTTHINAAERRLQTFEPHQVYVDEGAGIPLTHALVPITRAAKGLQQVN